MNITWEENVMKRYSLKSLVNKNDYMTIVQEMEDGYVIRIVRDLDGYNDIKTDFLSKELFECCIRTGYLTEIQESVKVAVSA